ncbi:1-acyl-sn-glycerol-3-phosphate acyltransferase [Chthoniobacter flavus]|nr:lysophospholipid acyltransferase family protein [Chthoniobacter flavus]TCO95632.1 1-acyl-sn-glycerol-3-phosphate acyltransferase [Chthoniobacter flavus]
MRIRAFGLEAARRPGGWLLACSHVSHLDPFCVGSQLPRRVSWMARIEFYRRGWTRALLDVMHAFPVNRQGVPVKAIKTALERLKQGEVVGVFPEGEIKAGEESVLRGAKIKRGVCLLSTRANCPVLPCVILGTDKLNAVGPWLPAKRGRLWLACGDFIEPVQGPDKHAARAEMAARIEKAMVELYARLRRDYGLEDSILP